MTRHSLAVLFGLFMPVIAHAGVVVFDPPIQEFHIDALPQRATFDLTIVADELSNDGGATHEFDSVSVWLSDAPPFPGVPPLFDLRVEDFRYSLEFISQSLFRTEPPRQEVIFIGYIWIPSGFALTPYPSPLLFGTVDVGIPPTLEPGDYLLRINTDDGISRISLGADSEQFVGLGIVRIIPEPATILLLLAGLLALTRRSRTLVRDGH